MSPYLEQYIVGVLGQYYGPMVLTCFDVRSMQASMKL